MSASPLPADGSSATDSIALKSASRVTVAPRHDSAAGIWLNRIEFTVVVLLALLVAALHLRFVTSVGGLWRDETNSVNLATVPSFAEMWRLLDYDSFPMLFFAVLRGWTAIFGVENDLALRTLGLITGLGILGALWANARSFGIKWPVLSFALVGLNPMLIRYGDSTRAYGLGILLILLTLRSFWRLVDSPNRSVYAASRRQLSSPCSASNVFTTILSYCWRSPEVQSRSRCACVLGEVWALFSGSACSQPLPCCPMCR